MQWWMYLLIALGVVAFFVIALICIRANNSKKVKFKIPELEKIEEKKAEPVKEEPKVEEFPGLIFDEFGGNEETLLSKSAIEEEEDPFEFDDILNEEDEQRYRDFMRRHESRGSRTLSEDEEFAKFRNEHCYSKYLTDPELLDRLVNVPPEVRPVILADLFKRINLDDIDSKTI